MKHQRAVVHDAALLQILGIAGKFFPFNADIVSAVDLSRHVERTQQLCNRLTEQTNIQIGCILCIEDKCEVQIPAPPPESRRTTEICFASATF